ncbi:hypothetical protein H0V99_03380 [Candidatus Saccharibacteria bacterium]|nr:hypothetical protein [Candidatus Saccharibacteria bacterium]
MAVPDASLMGVFEKVDMELPRLIPDENSVSVSESIQRSVDRSIKLAELFSRIRPTTL